MAHNISEQPLDPNFLRKHPRSYTEEPMNGDMDLIGNASTREASRREYDAQMGKIEFNDPTFRLAEDKIGGRNQMREKIAELIRELEKERKRSARWKACAKAWYDEYGKLYAIADTFSNLLQEYDCQTD